MSDKSPLDMERARMFGQYTEPGYALYDIKYVEQLRAENERLRYDNARLYDMLHQTCSGHVDLRQDQQPQDDHRDAADEQ